MPHQRGGIEMDKEEKILGIEDITDEIAKEHVEELYKAFKELVDDESFDINMVDKHHEKTWDQGMEHIDLKSAVEEVFKLREKNPKEKVFMRLNMLITKLIKSYAYDKYKMDYMWSSKYDKLVLGDFYLFKDNEFYTLDMYSDIDNAGYNKDLYQEMSGNKDNRLFFCDLAKYKGRISADDFEQDIEKRIYFIYDADEKKVLDITELHLSPSALQGYYAHFGRTRDLFRNKSDNITSWGLRKRN